MKLPPHEFYLLDTLVVLFHTEFLCILVVHVMLFHTELLCIFVVHVMLFHTSVTMAMVHYSDPLEA